MNVRRTKWTSKRTGRTRRIRLYSAWRALNARVAGTNLSGGKSYWTGLPVDFASFDHFRSWSRENGYSRERCSLDRIDSALGYSPANCRWVTRSENSRSAVAKSHRTRWGYTGPAAPAAPAQRLIESRAAANRNASAL